MRKLCTIFIALALAVLCVVLIPTHAQAAEITTSGTCGDNLTWTLDDKGVLTILGTGAMDNYPLDADIRSAIETVIIEDGVTTIGGAAFSGCKNLTSVTISDSVTHIYGGAFSSCSKLTSISIPDSVTEIGPGAFSYCTRLTNITLPDGITSIQFDTFLNCTSLTSITIPNSVTTIADAFSGFPLTSYNIPSGVTSVPQGLLFFDPAKDNVVYCGTREQWEAFYAGFPPYQIRQPNYHNRVDVVTMEPTYTSMGEERFYCTCCNKEITETIPAKFYGTSINLGNTLDMYFGFYTGLVDENSTVKFVRWFDDGLWSETTEVPITSFNKNNSVYDIIYPGLAAKEMCETIHVYVYNGDGELVGQHSDSIRSYVLRQLREKEHDAEFRTLCVDLLNYGAAAQTAFSYRTGYLANKDLTAEELAEGTQTVAAYTDKQIISGAADCYYGTSYLLEEKISMVTALKINGLSYYWGTYEGCYAIVSYANHMGEQKTDIRVEGVVNNDVCEFFFNEMVVADGRCLFTIEYYLADGTLVATVQDSMEGYTARNAEYYPLAEKMLAFSDSAYNYLHRNDN